MSSLELRHSVRAVVLDEDDRILLCRFAIPEPAGLIVVPLRNDYFLVRTPSFQPRGAMSDDELAAENIVGFRWWLLRDGPELFSPRNLATPLAALIAGGVPDIPVPLGW
jgi:hypothetical protein